MNESSGFSSDCADCPEVYHADYGYWEIPRAEFATRPEAEAHAGFHHFCTDHRVRVGSFSRIVFTNIQRGPGWDYLTRGIE